MSEGKEKFTPGPWVIQRDAWGISVICEESVSGIPFAETPICDISQEEDTGGMQDAALIAAAPDMYAALKNCERYFVEKGCPHEHPVLQDLRAALAKARGDAV